MVFVNGLKYACEACIKGHRSSSCAHTDRPLFEIKKKGRPVTQCEHCRQLRKTKQVHIKCSCGGASEVVRKEVGGKAKRKMPISPDFPKGLTGQSLNPSPAHLKKLKVASSSNDCNCKSSGHCSCATPIANKSGRLSIREPSSDANSTPATPPPLSSLSSCCNGKAKSSYDSQQLVQSNAGLDIYPTPLLNEYVGTAPEDVTSSSYDANNTYYGSGPPLLTLSTSFSWPSSSGVGLCSCGALCACPGCYEHSDPTTALSSESCPYACATCSQCNGFGFAPSTPTQNLAWPPNSNTGPSFNSWLQPNLTPSLPSFSSSSSTPAQFSNSSSSSSLTSDRCGGSCKCTAQHLSCECPSECCGCCFSCSCSDSGSVGTAAAQDEDMRERIGFAVSGERGSCCSVSKS